MDGVEPDADMDAFLDLSFLTEEEQNAIAEVLQRDSQLRLLEEGRISKLRESVSDPSWLKVLSGDWFCDVRSKRHNHFGSDLVRASIRRKRKPKVEWGPKQQGSLGDLEPIREPSAEEEKENIFDMQDAVDRLSREGVTPLTPSKEAQDATQSLEQVAETTPAMRRDSFSSLSSETEEEERPQTRPQPAVLASVQSNGSQENGREGASGSTPPKTHTMSPQNKMLSASSSFSSLSSSTMSGSLMSVFSDSEVGCVEVRGCVQFSLQYNTKKKELHVQIIQCRDLAEARKQRTDPYIKTYLLPDKSNQGKRKTAIKKRSLDPIFNETLKYKIDKAELQGRILNLSVWHHDSLSRNLFMGEVEIALKAWDWGNTGPQWFNLQPRVNIFGMQTMGWVQTQYSTNGRTPVTPDTLSSRGKLNLALKFISAGSEDIQGGGLPPTGELHIWVKNAQNLIPFKGGAVDSFVQCYILPDDSKASRQKTRTVKKNLSPIFNHTMVYDGFQAKDLAEACAEFTIWNQDTFSKQRLGGIRLSLGTGKSYGLPVPWMDSTKEERNLWEMVFKQPGQWVEAGLPLRTDLSLRTYPPSSHSAVEHLHGGGWDGDELSPPPQDLQHLMAAESPPRVPSAAPYV